MTANGSTHIALVGVGAHIRGSTNSLRMVFLTCCQFGMQFCGAIQLIYTTPFLLELGLPKSRLALVSISGAITGLIVHPLVGDTADRCTSKWGRRRPFMAAGTAMMSLCLFTFAWAPEAVGLIFADPPVQKPLTLLLAIVCFYLLDFGACIAGVQARNLIVEALPSAKQPEGSAWASRVSATGNVLGFGVGALDLNPYIGHMVAGSQLKQMVALGILVLCTCMGITLWAVDEKVLTEDEIPCANGNVSILDVFGKTIRTAVSLPSQLLALGRLNFWTSLAWSPFFLYGTPWIGEVYLRFTSQTDLRKSSDAVGEIGRVSGSAWTVFSMIVLISSVTLPWIIDSPDSGNQQSLLSIVGTRHQRPTLAASWVYSHIVFALAMMCTPFVTSLAAAKVLIALCGIPWAMQCWAPWAFIGIEISRANASSSNPTKSLELLDKGEDDVWTMDDTNGNAGEKTGLYMAALSLYGTIATFISTFLSWMVFAIFSPGTSSGEPEEAYTSNLHKIDGSTAIHVCLFIGATASVVAAYATSGLRS